MKLKKTILSVVACMLSFVLAFAFAACSNNTDGDDPVITAITIDPTSKEMDQGDTFVLTVTATYDDESTAKLTSRNGLTFESSAEAVATVSANGLVTAVSKGTATVTAKIDDFTATCALTVHSFEMIISGLDVADGKLELDVDDTRQLNVEVKRDGETLNEEIEWSSSEAGLVSVSASGLVTAVNPGNATVTAKLANSEQSASIDVTVNEPAGYAKVATYEQNKTPANTWGYWGDNSYNWSQTTIHSAGSEPYSEVNPEAGYEFIEAGKMSLTYTINSWAGTMQPGPNDSSIQLFYRSSKENGGHLEANHNYSVKLTILSTYSGTVVVNPYEDVDGRYTAGDNIEDHTFELVANEAKTVEVTFRHGDSGAIYAEGHWTNVESALMILLGLVGGASDEDLGNMVKVSVYNVQFKDLGESEYKWVDDPEDLGESSGSQNPPAGDGEAIEFTLDTEYMDKGETNGTYEGQYTITAGEDKKSATVEYTTYTTTYEAFYIDISENEAAQSGNTFEVTVKNEGSDEAKIRFDINGTTAVANYVNTVVSWVSSNGKSGKVDEYGGTEFTISGGAEVTLYFTYDTSERGALTNISIYFDTLWAGGSADNNWQGTQEVRTGKITISDLKFYTAVEEIGPVVPLGTVTATKASLAKEDEKAVFIIEGTLDLEYFGDTETAESWLTNKAHFDLQQSGGGWATYSDFEVIDATVDSNGSFTVKYDVTKLVVDEGGTGAYTCHFTTKEESEDGYKDNNQRDLKLDTTSAVPGQEITVGNKKYSIVNNYGMDGQENNWGCVSIKVEEV